MRKRLIIIRTVGAIATIVLLVVLFTGPRMRNQPSIQPFESIINLPEEDAVPFYNESTNSKSSEVPINEQNIARGKVYYGYYCVFCHGQDGKGDGLVGVSYIPKPSDLTRLKTYDSVQLNEALFSGIGHSPVLERIIPAEHLPYILLYVRSLRGK